MILTESLILSKAKGFSRTAASKDVCVYTYFVLWEFNNGFLCFIAQIKSINLWGQNLSDVSCLAGIRGLEVVSLPVNRISDLSPFSDLNNLEELYLRKNEILDPRELRHLMGLPRLKNLWISENPFCDKIKDYRLSMIRLFPNLDKLDDKIITDRERRDAAKIGDSGSENGGSPTSVASLSPAKVSPVRTKSVPAPKQQSQPQQRASQPPPFNANHQHPQNSYSDDDLFFGNIHNIEQRYSQASAKQQQQQQQYSNSSDEESHLAAQLLANHQRQQRLSKSYDDRPIRPSPVIGSFDSKLNLIHPFPHKPTSKKPSYQSQILLDKQFQDHLTVSGGLKATRVPIENNLDYRKSHDPPVNHPPSKITGGGAPRVAVHLQQQYDHRRVNPNWDTTNEHLDGAAVSVVNDRDVNSDFRRRNLGPFGGHHLVGAGANVGPVRTGGVHDYRHKVVDLHPGVERRCICAGRGLKLRLGRRCMIRGLGRLSGGSSMLGGVGLLCIGMRRLGFRLLKLGGMEGDAGDETVKVSGVGKVVKLGPKPKPDWLKAGAVKFNSTQPNNTKPLERQSSNNLLLAVLSIVKDLDTTSLHVVQHEVNRLLDSDEPFPVY
ncbi:hypothetical protein BCR33DRAFT_794152 [Rhizoclosmatium globosum]|uniref:Outer arm dynein light chain 1 n=1 Tax=Rhizoclosmatium globosum TaxID=329046 RepID=A0A1Y2AW85_9FUNG|nr:hypothetical protein BCR33DRAFT_794152 [Rhizoclosmatium globosum]|eukprot:ORY26851.1 hypothetical protein BCR33DRAFT_794152 [Rhizoclosmatium globosum]